VTAETAREIARRHIRPNRIATRVRWKIEELKGWPAGYPLGPPAPPDAYLAKQKRIVLENCGSIDPLNIDDYLARDGYRALAMCLGAQGPIGDHAP
jgi:hypothetical protein